MFRKPAKDKFEQTLAKLWAHQFEEVLTVEGYSVKGAYVVGKYGVAVVVGAGADSALTILAGPGLLVGREIAQLLDRGYQKFFKTSTVELPASAAQLDAIHRFTEELKQVAGTDSLYNESLGTTSDSYQYDRLRGR